MIIIWTILRSGVSRNERLALESGNNVQGRVSLKMGRVELNLSVMRNAPSPADGQK